MLTNQQLIECVSLLRTRPGHENVRTQIARLLIDGLGAAPADVRLEQAIPEARGRADALLGRTVFEFKLNLQREGGEAESQLQRYIAEKERETHESYIGVATDGADYRVYALRDGELVRIGRDFRPPSGDSDPRAILRWLETVVSVQAEVEPLPELVEAALGRESTAYGIARRLLGELWAEARKIPDVELKRTLWGKQLQMVYGSPVDNEDLFLQHTYLTIVAKTMATAVLMDEMPPKASDLLSGKAFEDAAVHGAVESDFFDWVLEVAGGEALVQRVSRQVRSFRLRAVNTDVLKGLYESLIDPETRHELGEYYTPDWLAELVCQRAISSPLEQRVLDPACGSGTFVFHAVRRHLEAADAAGISNEAALASCGDHVFGIDVHPVAVIIARVTYLLALGDRLGRGRGAVNVPVYLGDALQWNAGEWFAAEGQVLVDTGDQRYLQFPRAVASDPSVYDAVVARMLDLAERRTEASAFEAWLENARGIRGDDLRQLSETYRTLVSLYDEDRNHIWGYICRNLGRPVWLSSSGQRAHVVIGNPPWLSYRYMSPEMQSRFRSECKSRRLWAGGKLATHQDLSAYFFVRAMELYLRRDGLIAFVMPYAALNRLQFAGLRAGKWTEPGRKHTRTYSAEARFVEAWGFDEHLQPLFPVPSCVLIAEHRAPVGLPSTINRARGTLPRRNVTLSKAEGRLAWETVPWPRSPSTNEGSVYRSRFRQGATMVPRMLVVVELATVGELGGASLAPLVQSLRTRQEKQPWRSLPSLRSRVESQFVRPIYLGESIAPFRPLEPGLAVVPFDEAAAEMLSSQEALVRGFEHLAEWLRRAETAWHANRGATTTVSLAQQLDYFGKLSAQFPVAPLRVLYAASGTLPAACVSRDSRAVVEHKVYWAPAGSTEEARYLVSVLNSEVARSRVEHLQSRGQWGARDFDKVMFELPIPEFDPANSLHGSLAEAGARAEQIAAAVPEPEKGGFIRMRQEIRKALNEDGVSQRIDELVAALLESAEN